VTRFLGLFIGCSIVLLWFAALSLGLQINTEELRIWHFLWVLVQTHLFTGLFITAHDAMHGTVSHNTFLNNLIGQLTAGLYAAFYLPHLRRLHHLHHGEVVGEKDPDYHDGGFFSWYYTFFSNYVRWYNFLAYAIAFNLLKLIFPAENLLLFWILPVLISTFQLFYFGTYIPHKKENHHLPHSAGSQTKNHFLAFFSCYFFGYHQEHHESPAIPWWRLYKSK